jgi:hypothetical protein
MAVWNAMLGRKGQEAEVAEVKQQGAPALYRVWLDTLSDEEFRNVTGLNRRSDVDDCLCHCLMERTSHLAALIKLLERLLGDTALDAKGVLESDPFLGMAVPFNAHPQGLDSAPEDVRNDLQACLPLMKQLQENVMHYYVAGRTVLWNKEQKRLIATWLVFMWDEVKARYNRSMWSAEKGKDGELAAIYHSPLVLDDTLTTYLCPTHLLKLPTSKIIMDGRHRAFSDTPQAVAHGIMAQFVNSSLNEQGRHDRVPNCTREWNLEWSKLGTQKSAQHLAEVAMGVKLLRNVDMYEELHYVYHWGKYDKDSDHLLQLTKRAPHNAAMLRS